MTGEIESGFNIIVRPDLAISDPPAFSVLEYRADQQTFTYMFCIDLLEILQYGFYHTLGRRNDISYLQRKQNE